MVTSAVVLPAGRVTHFLLLSLVWQCADGGAEMTGQGAVSEMQDEARMRQAVALAWQCPPSATAFSVGAVVVAADGTELATGFSREGGDLAVVYLVTVLLPYFLFPKIILYFLD